MSSFVRFALVVLVLTFPTGLSAQTPNATPAFSSPKDLVAWITGYREAPDPAAVPKAVDAMSRLGLFRDSESAAFYIGFIAGVLGDNQLTASEIVEDMFPMPPPEQAVIIKAIAYSGLPDWKGLLTQFVGHMPARKVLIRTYLFDGGETLETVPLDNGNAVVDTLWGYYFATGSYQPVLRILAALRWTEEQTDIKRLVIGNMAMVTLASNAARDQNLLDLYHVQLPYQDKTVQKPLRQMVQAIESFETHKIRTAAQEAIAKGRRRGPLAKTSKWQWANKVGQTALSVGCVVAGALGHVEIAAPCIITGALYSGASNLVQLGTPPSE